MKVLIADKFPDQRVSALQEAGCEVVLDPSLKDDKLTAAIRQTGCNALVVRSTKVAARMLDASPGLLLVIRAGSGYDTIDVAGATERNIRVCNCPGMNSVAVAELTIGLMIALDRQIADEVNDFRRGVWNKQKYGKARGLKGRTLGMIGLGRIGYEVAKRAAAFDMRLIYQDVIDQKEMEKELGIEKLSFEQVLAESDFITLHVPGGAGTKHLIGKNELAKMKPTAFLLNCARGGVVDDVALADAVESGVIAGAALDVYEDEPAATDSEFTNPIRMVRGVYGTHHVGASTQQAQDAVADEVVRVIRGYIEKREFVNCVNPM
jgi:D-3-phosphoglycerate dehydrogenase